MVKLGKYLWGEISLVQEKDWHELISPYVKWKMFSWNPASSIYNLHQYSLDSPQVKPDFMSCMYLIILYGLSPVLLFFPDIFSWTLFAKHFFSHNSAHSPTKSSILSVLKSFSQVFWKTKKSWKTFKIQLLKY